MQPDTAIIRGLFGVIYFRNSRHPAELFGAPNTVALPRCCCLLPAGAQRTDGALLHSQAALGRADRLIDASDDVPSSTGDLGARAPPVVQSTAGRTQQQVEQDAGAQLECGTRLGVAVTKCDGDELSDAAVHADPLGGLLAVVEDTSRRRGFLL